MKKKICAFVFVSLLGFASICPAPMIDVPRKGTIVKIGGSPVVTVNKAGTQKTVWFAWFVRTFQVAKAK